MGIWGRSCERGRRTGGKERAGSWVPQAYWGIVVHAFNPREAEAGESVRLSVLASSRTAGATQSVLCSPNKTPKRHGEQGLQERLSSHPMAAGLTSVAAVMNSTVVHR